MNHFRNNFFLGLFLLLGMASTGGSATEISAQPVKVNLLKKKEIVELLKIAVTKLNIDESDIEANQIVEVKQFGSFTRYIVPVRINSGDDRGCYVLNFDEKVQPRQKLLLSKLDELEICQHIASVFSCNREKGLTSGTGIGVLYVKRIGANHHWFEGSYFALNQAGLFNENEQLSEKLNRVERATVARKKLACH